MTDTYRGYDLTALMEEVGRRRWHTLLAASDLTEESKGQRTWDKLPPSVKFAFKDDLVQIVTTVIDSLAEIEGGGRVEIKTMRPYDYSNHDRQDARWYENQHPLQHDVNTATVWTLHLNIHPNDKDAVLGRMAIIPQTTGEYTYDGDSFSEWGTASSDPDDQHMAIYFNATKENAAGVGYSLANHASFAVGGHNSDVLPYVVSTSGDYAEQIPNLDELGKARNAHLPYRIFD